MAGVYRHPFRPPAVPAARTLSWRQPGNQFLTIGGVGFNFQGVSTLYAGAGLSLTQGTGVLPGDTLLVAQNAVSGGFQPTAHDDGTVTFNALANTQRFSFTWYNYQRITGTVEGPATVWVNEVQPQWGAFNFPTPFLPGNAITPINLNGNPYAVSPEGDALTFSLLAGALPAGLTLSNAGIISGLPSDQFPATYTWVIGATDSTGSTTPSPATLMDIEPIFTLGIPDNIRVRTPPRRSVSRQQIPDWQSLSRTEAEKVRRIDRKLREARNPPPPVEEAPAIEAPSNVVAMRQPMVLGHVPHTDDQDIARLYAEEHAQLMALAQHAMKVLH